MTTIDGTLPLLNIDFSFFFLLSLIFVYYVTHIALSYLIYVSPTAYMISDYVSLAFN